LTKSDDLAVLERKSSGIATSARSQSWHHTLMVLSITCSLPFSRRATPTWVKRHFGKRIDTIDFGIRSNHEIERKRCENSKACADFQQGS